MENGRPLTVTLILCRLRVRRGVALAEAARRAVRRRCTEKVMSDEYNVEKRVG